MFSSRQLRPPLARVQERVAVKRRLAAAALFVAAVAAWFVMPGYAADYRLDSAGDRYGTISYGIGGRGSYPIHIPGYNNENAGTLLMHEIGGGDVQAYCIDLRGVRNPAATFHGSDHHIDQIAFLLNHYFPTVPETGGIGDANYEAAAVQLAVWTFSDGINLDSVSAPTVPNFAWVVNRARALRMEAQTNWAEWARQQQTPPAVTLTPGAPAIAPGSTTLSAAVSGGPGPGVPNASPITFTVTSTAGAVDGQQSVTKSVNNGTASVQVASPLPGQVTVDVEVTRPALAYLRLNPDVQPNQTLVLASQLPVTGRATQSLTFAGAPKLSLVKSVSAPSATAAATGSPNMTVKPGDTVTYTLAYSNTGNASARGATINDDLGRGALAKIDLNDLAVEGGRAQSVDRRARTATWQLGDLPPGGSGTVHLTAKLPTSGDDDGSGIDFCNVGSLSSTGSPVVSSNQACAHMTTTPHLLAVKTVDTPTSIAGQPLRYTITVRNDGNRILRRLVVSDTLKGNNLERLSDVQPDDGGTYDTTSRSLSWEISSLAPGNSMTTGFRARVSNAEKDTAEMCLVNVAVVSGGNSGGTYASPPVSTCVHPAALATTPAPAVLAVASPSSVATPSPSPSASQSTSPTAVTGSPAVPVTGAHGIVRSILSGLCLVLSGVVLIFGERRNLHAKALRKEAGVVADALAGKGGLSSGGSRRRYDARRAG